MIYISIYTHMCKYIWLNIYGIVQAPPEATLEG